MTYGMFCNLTFEPHNPDHVKRDYKSLYAVSGDKLVPDAFYIILPKVCQFVFPFFILPSSFRRIQDTQVSETKEFRRSFFREAKNTSEFSASTSIIQCYRGNDPLPKWKDEDTGVYMSVPLF